MRALSDDLRLRIHEACEAGESLADVAERFEVNLSTVKRLRRRFRDAGTLSPKPGGRGPTPKLAPRMADLRAAVEARPDATPDEHGRELNWGVSRWTVWRAIRRLGMTVKKKSFMRRSNSDPT
jgi:transposase